MIASATKPLPRAYFHRPGKDRPQNTFQRQNAAAVRARSKAKYHANPATAKAINAEWQREHPEARREHVSRWWKRNKHRPEVKQRNAVKSRVRYWRTKARKVRESLKVM